MKKTNNLWIVLGLIFIIIFNAWFFVVGGAEHIASAWISYGFIHCSYMLLILTLLLIHKRERVSIFGFSLYLISAMYFLIEFVIGNVFILASQDNYKAALLVQLVLAGCYAITLISHMIANEHTANAEEERQYQIAYVKDVSMKLEFVISNISDIEAKMKVERVYDAIYSSPVKTHASLAQMETGILLLVNELGDAVSAGNKGKIISLANTILKAMNERNMKLRMLN